MGRIQKMVEIQPRGIYYFLIGFSFTIELIVITHEIIFGFSWLKIIYCFTTNALSWASKNGLK